METITESELIQKDGFRPYSISVNSTGNKITPFSTHIKVYKDDSHFYESGEYCYNLTDAMTSFTRRCENAGTLEKGDF
tara:strand:+ start:325 stop:558 length:234 start_codon:yes stop_codon:yes gene_type:complete